MEVAFGTIPTGLRGMMTDMDIHGIGAQLMMSLGSSPNVNLSPSSKLLISREYSGHMLM